MSKRQWHAVFTQPQREALAAEHLERQGFTVFFPRQTRTVRHARKITQRQVSYFPNYIFVSLDLSSDPWRRVNGTRGVRGLVMTGDRPAAAPADFINQLQLSCGEDGLVVRNDLQTGEKVRLLAGPFSETVGVIGRLDGAARIQVLLEILGRTTPILTHSANVALAS